MRRSAQLRDLSREHPQALRYALQLKNAVAGGRSREQIYRFVATVTREHLLPHFALEESALLSMLKPADLEYAAIRRMLAEHKEIPELAKQLLQGECADDERLLHFAGMLKQHVRLEENEAFPLLEELLSTQALDAAQAEIEAGHKFVDIGWD
ncbi:MAG: hemerythrin domain-containing protein [Pseudomonadota bacterium]|nr:hemerythrin domain-containing protein [Pseudomonadota bacterium]